MRFDWKAQVTFVLVALGLAIYAGWHYRGLGASNARLVATVDSLEAVRGALADSVTRLEGRYHTDTVRLRVVKTQTDTLTATVEVWKRDTVKVTEYVTKADSTIKSCVQALQTCEERVGVERRLTETALAERDAYRRALPSKFAPLIHRTQGFVVGALAYALLKK